MESGVVGYQQIDVNNGYSFRTVTFKNITQTEFDLTEIVPLHADGTPFGESILDWCMGNVMVRKIDAEGAYGTPYSYYSLTDYGAGWSSDGGDTIIGKNVMKLKAGEGVIIYCDCADLEDNPQDAKLQVSGEVVLAPRAEYLPGYSFGGNFTPVAIDLTQIIPQRWDADENKWVDFGESLFDWCMGNVMIRKINAEGAYGTPYSFYSLTDFGPGWSTDGGDTIVSANVLKFAPGEGFILYNDYADLEETPLNVALKLPAPIK